MLTRFRTLWDNAPPSLSDPSPSPPSRLAPWVQRSADVMMGLVLIGTWLLGGTVLVLIGRDLWHGPWTYAHVLTLLDPLLLLLMLAELLHSLSLALSTHHLPLKPFLALLWLAAVRRLLVVITTATTFPLVTIGPLFVGLLILSAVLVLLPAQSTDRKSVV